MGAVYILAQVPTTIRTKAIYIVFCCVVTVVSIWQSITNRIVSSPVFPHQVVAGMKLIKEITPGNSVIYSWWDDGHLLVHYGERPTLADGAFHGGQRISYLALPFVTDNFQLAANFIRFYSTQGLPGIRRFIEESTESQQRGYALLQEILSLGPKRSHLLLSEKFGQVESKSMSTEKWIEYLFPQNGPEVYLFLNNRHFKPNLQRSIYWYGTWDTDKYSGGKTLPTLIFSNVALSNTGGINTNNLAINYNDGTLYFPQMLPSPLPLASITTDRGALPVKRYNFVTEQDERLVPQEFQALYRAGRLPHLNPDVGQYNLEVLPSQNKLLLQDTNIAAMTSQLLFFHGKSINTPYFSLVVEDPTYFQIWKVQGD